MNTTTNNSGAVDYKAHAAEFLEYAGWGGKWPNIALSNAADLVHVDDVPALMIEMRVQAVAWGEKRVALLIKMQAVPVFVEFHNNLLTQCKAGKHIVEAALRNSLARRQK